MPGPLEIDSSKQSLRERLRKLRRDQQDKDRLSQAAFEQLAELRPFQEATTILMYVDVRDELRTQAALRDLLKTTATIAVPYCSGNSLRLVKLESFDDLIPGAFGILEPNKALKQNPARAILPTAVDVAVIPGLGFDQHGSRIGHGKGYYDRLLPQLRTDCVRIGLGFGCQLIDEIPVLPHDQQMNFIVTEQRVIDCHTPNEQSLTAQLMFLNRRSTTTDQLSLGNRRRSVHRLRHRAD